MTTIRVLIAGWSIVWSFSIISFGFVEFRGVSLAFYWLGQDNESIIFFLAPFYLIGVWLFGCALIFLSDITIKTLKPVLSRIFSHPRINKAKIKLWDKPLERKVIVYCCHCGGKLRLPFSEKSLIVKCPSCEKKFEFTINGNDELMAEYQVKDG